MGLKDKIKFIYLVFYTHICMVQKAAYTEGLVFAVQSIGLFKQVSKNISWSSVTIRQILQLCDNIIAWPWKHASKSPFCRKIDSDI